MHETTDQSAGARLLDDLSARADDLADAIAEFGGDDLHAKALDLANGVVIAKAVLTPCLAAAPEPLKVRAIDWNWRRLDEVTEDDVVWDPTGEEWAEVEFVTDDMACTDHVVQVKLALGSGGVVAGKPTDVVRVADQALANMVDAALDDRDEADMVMCRDEAI